MQNTLVVTGIVGGVGSWRNGCTAVKVTLLLSVEPIAGRLATPTLDYKRTLSTLGIVSAFAETHLELRERGRKKSVIPSAPMIFRRFVVETGDKLCTGF